MAKDIPIHKVPPTYDARKQVEFTNIDKEDFTHSIDGKLIRFKKGRSILLSEPLAYHFAKHLAQKIIFRNDASLTKYTGVDQKENRKKISKGETPIITGLKNDAISGLVAEILNGHVLEPSGEPAEVTDAEEIGVAVDHEEDKKEDPLAAARAAKADKAAAKKAEEEKKDEFEGVKK